MFENSWRPVAPELLYLLDSYNTKMMCFGEGAIDLCTHEKAVFFLPVNIFSKMAFLVTQHTTVCLDHSVAHQLSWPHDTLLFILIQSTIDTLYATISDILEHCCTQLMLLGIIEYHHQCVHNPRINSQAVIKGVALKRLGEKKL